MKQFACGAVVPGCAATFTAQDEPELLQQVAAHAKQEHGLDDVPPELVDQVRAATTTT